MSLSSSLNPTIVEPDWNCEAATGDETTLDYPEHKRARTQSPILKLKFQKLGSEVMTLVSGGVRDQENKTF